MKKLNLLSIEDFLFIRDERKVPIRLYHTFIKDVKDILDKLNLVSYEECIAYYKLSNMIMTNQNFARTMSLSKVEKKILASVKKQYILKHFNMYHCPSVRDTYESYYKTYHKDESIKDYKKFRKEKIRKWMDSF